MRIVFLHPDLGIGGAERLIVDSALALQSKGHEIYLVTNHHDKNHCFKETKDGTLNVTTVGSLFPRNIFGRCQALCAYLRLIIASIWLSSIIPADDIRNDADVIFVDQISAPIIFIKLINLILIRIFGSTKRCPKIIFYCHFPDQLLTPRLSMIKKLYRLPIDFIEEFSTGLSDLILVNSKFTESVFRSTFKSLNRVPLQVLHPSVHFDSFDKPIKSVSENANLHLDKRTDTLFLSLNRFERKKNLELAIKSFDYLINKLITDEKDKKRAHLIIAGGYDPNNSENIEYHSELYQMAKEMNITDQITFIKSLSDEDKQALLHSASAVIYTPSNEHFGIVPIEAMYMRRPVIAIASGGPLETVVDGETGFLCRGDENCGDARSVGDQFSYKSNDVKLISSFARAMFKFMKDKSLSREMGENGRERVKKWFSFQSFTDKLNLIVTNSSNQVAMK